MKLSVNLQKSQWILSKQRGKKRLKEKEQGLNNLWDSIKQSNVHVIRVPEGGERADEEENVFEEILEFFKI